MQDIRVTSGKYRGRSIKSPNIKSTHPMGAREKLALFNMLTDYLPGANVLDAYAGSGALGIEALSRGAAYVTFIEKNPQATKAIRKNLADLDLLEFGKASESDVKNFSSPDRFDIIIADPPYNDFKLTGIENIAGFLKESGVMVVSHPNEAPKIPTFKLIKTHKYAAAHLSFYRKDI